MKPWRALLPQFCPASICLPGGRNSARSATSMQSWMWEMYIFVSAGAKWCRMLGQHQTDGSEEGRRSERSSLPPSQLPPPHPPLFLWEISLHGSEELHCTKEDLIPPTSESAHSNKAIKVVHQWEHIKTTALRSVHSHGCNSIGKGLGWRRTSSRRNSRIKSTKN